MRSVTSSFAKLSAASWRLTSSCATESHPLDCLLRSDCAGQRPFVGDGYGKLARWGLPKTKGSGLIINARGETIDRLPTFRAAFQESRVIVPASGWYEWAGGKRPHHFAIGDIALFAGI